MAIQIFVYLEGGIGDLPARQAFEVQSYSMELDQPAANERLKQGSAGGGAGAGRAYFSPLTLLKKVDNASAALFKACATASYFRKARLDVSSGSGDKVFLTYTFSPVFVQRVRTVGNQGELPLEEVELVYGAEQSSFRATNPDGTLAPPTQAGWSQITNSPDPGTTG